MSLVAIVPGEAELGPQRFCTGCRSWWPDTLEFYAAWGGWRHGRCRACEAASRAASAAQRAHDARTAAAEAQRATWRRQQASWRARRRAAA